MKQIITVIVVGLAGYLGYKFEPELRFTLTGIPYGVGHGHAKAQLLNIDPTTLRPDQLPKEVTIFATIPFKDSTSGLVVNVPAGSKHKPVKVEGKDVQIEITGTQYRLKLPISKTDLLEQLSQMPISPTPPPPAVEPTPEPEPAEPEAPKPPVETPAPIAETPPPTNIETSPADALKMMRDTLQSGKIKEFNIDQVVTWNQGGTENIDGINYTTGTVGYETKTILGQKTMQAKALIRNGTIEKWIWPASGVEIK